MHTTVWLRTSFPHGVLPPGSSPTPPPYRIDCEIYTDRQPHSLSTARNTTVPRRRDSAEVMMALVCARGEDLQRPWSSCQRTSSIHRSLGATYHACG